MATISQNLTDRYNDFIGKVRPWDFFMGLANYLEYVHATPALKKVVEEQVAIRDAEFAEIERLEEQSSNEFREAWKQLMTIVEKHKLDVSTFTAYTSAIPTPPGRALETIVEQMEAYEDGRISMSGFHSDHLERFVFDVAANLTKLGYGEELGEYAVTIQQAASYFAQINGPSDNGLVYAGNEYGNFIFSKTWPERFSKVRSVERARDHKVWGAFDDLLKFWEARQEFLKGAGFFETMRDVESTEYKFGGKDALEVAWAVKDLEVMEENHDTSEEPLHFLRVEDFRTRAASVAGALLSSLPENNTPEALMKARARKQALDQARDKYWKQAVNAHMEHVEAFMERYEEDRVSREADEIIEQRWWSNGATPSFESASGKIFLDDKSCQIPLTAGNQQAVCSKLFESPIGTWLMEVDVINNFSRGDQSPRAFSDAVRAINKQIYTDFGIRKMLEYSASRRVRVRKEVFEDGESQ
jgi:hypothetical protein